MYMLRHLELIPLPEMNANQRAVMDFAAAIHNRLAEDDGLASASSWQNLGALWYKHSSCVPGPSFMLGAIDEQPGAPVMNDGWAPGTRLEAEMMDRRVVCYYGTIHPVEVVERVGRTNEYQCRLLAFGEDDVDVWERDLLHEPRGAVCSSFKRWKVGENVHFRMRDRTVDGKLVDGTASANGIWIKGTIVSGVRKGAYMVRHNSWTTVGTLATLHVPAEDIRACYLKGKK
jgi:hypothetical protein